MSSIDYIKWIKTASPSFKPTLIIGLLLASSQVDCTNPCIASLIFLALDLVIGSSGTCKGSLGLGPPWFPSTGPATWRHFDMNVKTHIFWHFDSTHLTTSRYILFYFKILYINHFRIQVLRTSLFQLIQWLIYLIFSCDIVDFR